ncbi:MAG TPA: S8 family serine peptidase [Herpetosiphonaceae bacterium]|nr:S8 family serine peptidase [Herpetosiphonaceae bacterium]
MKLRPFLFIALIAPWILIAVAGSPAATAAPAAAPAAGPGPTAQLIVKFKDTAASRAKADAMRPAQLARLSAAAGIELEYVRPMSGDAHVLRLPAALSWAEAERRAKSLAALPEVEYAEPDQVYTLDDRALNADAAQLAAPAAPGAVPNDPMYGQQWHYRYTAGSAEGMNLVPAWDISKGSAATVVAVLDTGGVNHADMAGRFVAGYDMISDPFIGNDGDGRDSNWNDPGDWNAADQCGNGTDASDSSWHGTHVAGTIGAATNNSAGVAGVNWNAKIQHVRVLGRCGGTNADIADGIRWAAGLSVNGTTPNATPAKVLNLSLGGFGPCSATTQGAINAAVGAGATVVVAAGNSNANAGDYNPANCANVITVASTGPSGNRAPYSNYGTAVEVAAPGGDVSGGNSNGVLSTLNAGTMGPAADSYAFYQGTSMAAPHVAGLASLILALRPNYTSAQVLQLLQTTARAFPNGSSCSTSICGSGIVNAGAALAAIGSPLVLNKKLFVPTVIRPSAGGGGGIVNGNFESATGWTESAASEEPIVGPAPEGLPAHGGSRLAWLGGLDNEVATLQQQVSVPAGSPTLTFWYQVRTDEVFCEDVDSAAVKINGTAIWNKELCTATATGTWQQATVSLAAYAGQSVALQFYAETDVSDSSSFFVDDVSIP